MQSTALCPSCGRHVGPYEACPYCGAKLAPRITMRLFRYGSLAVALLGLAVLWFFSLRSPIPEMKIGQVQSTMNFAYVRVSGKVVRQSTFDAEGGYLGFWIRDDTGEMMVSSYRTTTQALMAANKLPDVGDEITLEGTLRIREDTPSLTLASAETVKLVRPEPQPYQIGDILPYDELQAVTVRGQVRQVKTPYEGLTLITLRDQTGAIDVAVNESGIGVLGIEGLGIEGLDVQPGDSVEVVGVVTLYKDTPQIALTSWGKLVKLSEKVDIAPFTKIADLTTERVAGGGMARVEGEVVQVKPFSAGVKLTVDDGSGRIVVLLWNDVYSALADRDKIVEGAIISAQGTLGQYRGEIELTAEAASDVVLLAKSRAAQVEQKPIGQVTAEDKTVAVKGVILESKRLSTGMRFVIGDETGKIVLLIWDDVLTKMPDRDKLGVGAEVTAQGKVEVYKDELEIVPRSGTDVLVTVPAAIVQPAPTATVAPRPTSPPTPTFTPVAPSPTPKPTATPLPQAVAINTITNQNVGQQVTIKGQVIDITSSSGGFTFWMDDGTGRIDLFLFSSVYGHVAGRTGLRLGAQVLATGEVKEYQGKLEIVPPLGEQVIVVSPASSAAPQRTIGSLSEQDKDQFFTFQVTIVGVTPLSGGTKFRVRDETGDIDLIIWDNVKAFVPDAAKLVEGARLMVTAKVGLYRGTPQIVPQLGYDVRIVE